MAGAVFRDTHQTPEVDLALLKLVMLIAEACHRGVHYYAAGHTLVHSLKSTYIIKIHNFLCSSLFIVIIQ